MSLGAWCFVLVGEHGSRWVSQGGFVRDVAWVWVFKRGNSIYTDEQRPGWKDPHEQTGKQSLRVKSDEYM